ncbi:MAG: hypothetical protein IKF47_01435 [Bacilli bacterium]|nr:hypothetical protein [Bacilli bacterium]
MNKQKKLLLERSIFILIVFVALGVIVITEKFGNIMIPKASKKINTYVDEKYKDLNLKTNDVTFKNTTYTMKVESKENKHHYFYINYYNRKITDTYKKDYVEGKNLLNYLKKKLKKEINNKTNTNCDIEITSTLDKYTELVQEKIIKEDNLLELKFYIIKKELVIDKWDEETITNKINNFLEKFENITPKSYTITITNKEDITESIEIKNITNEVTKEIISDIINNKKSDLLKENKITYKYLN